MTALVAALTAVAVAAPVSQAGTSPTAEADPAVSADKPDIIVIMTDDQRAGTERAMPYTWSFFGSSGVYYPRAEVPTNLCCPARATFLTGEYAHTTSVWENEGRNSAFAAFRRWTGPTLPRSLQDSGYQTSLFGKYMNYYNRDGGRGRVPLGWDVFHTYQVEEKGMAYWNKVVGLPKGYAPDVLGDAVVRQIQTADAEVPQFILYTPPAPHAPFDAGPYSGVADKRLLKRFRRTGEFKNPSFLEKNMRDKPRWLRGLNPSRKKLRRIADQQSQTLMAMDANVRRIVQAQETHRDLSNTAVVYLTDNGYAWGEHRLRLKRHPYLLSSRIPLLVKYPEGTEQAGVPGSTSTRLVNQLDVTATLAELAGAVRTGEGLSLLGAARTSLPLEASRTRGGIVRRPAYCGVRTTRFLFLKYADGTQELYDYAEDPYELRNVAGSRRYKKSKRALRRSLDPGCNVREMRSW